MSDLESKILQIIAERENVLFEIERTLFTKRYNLSNKHLQIFAVQSISMIYSIWEGFIQRVFQIYITEVNNLNIEFHELSNDMIVHCMENKYKQFFEYPQKKDRKVEFYNKLRDHHQVNVHLLPVNINTESNVGFEVLNKILCNFSLEKFPEHWERYTHPNPNLKQMLKDFLRYRNGVAHGGDISSEDKVTKQVYEKYKNLVIDLMYGVFERINAGFNNQTYRKIPIIC